MEKVDRWGVHWDGPYPFLVEPTGSKCLLEGATTLNSPFEPKPRLTDPLHDYLSALDGFGTATQGGQDPWAPNPSERGAYSLKSDTEGSVPSFGREALRYQYFPLWAVGPVKIYPYLMSSNIKPIVIGGYEWKDLSTLYKILDLPRIRPIIFAGKFVVPQTVVFESPPLSIENQIKALKYNVLTIAKTLSG